MATIQLTYTPEIADCHVVFFSIWPDRAEPSSRCEYLDETTSVAGVPKTISIDLNDYTSEGACLENYTSIINNCESVFDVRIQIVPCCNGIFTDYEYTITHTGVCP